jgi:hypothetical protein
MKELETKNIIDTEPGEIRYFLFEDDIPVKATGLEDGGLSIEKFINGEFKPAIHVILDVAEGSDLEEIDENQFQSLTNQ